MVWSKLQCHLFPFRVSAGFGACNAKEAAVMSGGGFKHKIRHLKSTCAHLLMCKTGYSLIDKKQIKLKKNNRCHYRVDVARNAFEHLCNNCICLMD